LAEVKLTRDIWKVSIIIKVYNVTTYGISETIKK
jgi:hypothetical protein